MGEKQPTSFKPGVKALGEIPQIFIVVVFSSLFFGFSGLAGGSSSIAIAKQHYYRAQTGDLPNLHRVQPFLYRGGEPTQNGFQKLRRIGVKTVIDLRGYADETASVESDTKMASSLGLKFVHIPMTVDHPNKLKVDQVISLISEAEKNHKPVYIHCLHGSDRTGTMVAIWRVKHEHWTYADAYREMLKYSFDPKFTKLASTVKESTQAGN